ncbi:MAG: hypothetical protein ACE5IR_05515 [bacterium]
MIIKKHENKIDIREIAKEDRRWIQGFIQERWGSKIAVSRGVVHHPGDLPGYLAIAHGAKQGLVTCLSEAGF